jgi:hypothetical protein
LSRILRRVSGKTPLDKAKSEDVGSCKVEDINEMDTSAKNRMEHINRMEDDRLVKITRDESSAREA